MKSKLSYLICGFVDFLLTIVRRRFLIFEMAKRDIPARAGVAADTGGNEFHKNNSLLCLGDSHILVFNYIRQHSLLRDFEIEIVEVGGASAQGMVNPNSRTDALNIFEKRLDTADRSNFVVMQLGEVDCGFVIWYYAEKYALSVEKQLERSLNNYFSFLANAKRMGFRGIIVLSAPLPTITDGQTWGKVANLRREVRASHSERTDLTIRYNKLLSEGCKERGILFLDTTRHLLDEETGVIKSGFLNVDKLNHHLDDKTYADLLCSLLEEALIDKVA